MSLLPLFLIALVAGLTGAMTGMGGGVILVPALTLLGVDIKHAIAVSIVSVIATSSGSASAYVRDHITNLKVGIFLQMFTMVGALIGAGITLASGKGLLFVLFGLTLLASFATMFVQQRQGRHAARQDAFSRWLELKGSYYDQAAHKTIVYEGVRAYIGGPAMLLAGMMAGLLGIGAGALKVLIFDLIMGLPAKVSTTTSNLIIGVTALAGASVYLAAGLLSPGLAAPVMLGVAGGAFLGTRLLVRLSNRTIRNLFMGVLLVLGLQMVVRGIGGG
jgi:uncharacterized membrane protein YfcA